MPNLTADKTINVFGDFLCHSLWRLFIDYNRQAVVGPQGVDQREPGYLKSVCGGFNYMLETLAEPLSLELLAGFHDVVVDSAIEQKVREAIELYQVEVALAASDDVKIYAIAKCARELKDIYPFSDGNCRTLMLVLNKLLLQQGLSPTILVNPNRIDAYSIEQICQEIKQGMRNFAEGALAPLPFHYQDDSLIYLEKNPVLSRLYAWQIASSCHNWSAVISKEQERALTTIASVLSNLDLDGEDKGLSWKQLENVSEIIKSQLESAIYKKSWYQPATLFYGKNTSYGIHFPSSLNQYLVPETFDVSKLNEELHQSLRRPQLPF